MECRLNLPCPANNAIEEAMIKSLTATFGLLLAASPALADTLIYNVNGVQVGADGKLDRFSGLVFGDDGKVLQIVNADRELQRPVEHEIDGAGRTLLPGLIDAHGHVMGLGFGALQLDLSGTGSIFDVQHSLERYAAARPKLAWITGRGWNQERWPDKRFPTASDLDEVVSDRPVVLERVDGHAVVVNSAALKAAGITAASKDPVGGKIEKDAKGNPTGLLIDAATELVGRKIPSPTAAQQDEALLAAQELMLSNGLTAAADMGTTMPEWLAMNRAGKSGKLKVRILSYAAGPEVVASTSVSRGFLAPRRPVPWQYDDRLRQGGVKLYADGALGSRGAWLKQPYSDKPNTRGLQFLTDTQILDQADKSAGLGFQLAIHAIGDAANAQVISTYEALSKRYPGDRRWRIEHFQIVDPADIPRLKPAGIIASMQPTHQTSDRLMAEARLGPERLKGAYAWQTVEQLGIPLAFGSDFPVESPNPFPGLSAAISRQDVNGQPPGGWRPEERLSFEQALAAFTRGAAYAGFAEDRIGSLEPGKWADFILVDRDVSKVDAQALAATKVLETWVAGKKVWAASTTPGAERGR
jgi:predicted amidohydrolase YtcJ